MSSALLKFWNLVENTILIVKMEQPQTLLGSVHGTEPIIGASSGKKGAGGERQRHYMNARAGLMKKYQLIIEDRRR
uniref:Uncharacterized protein n=1 Tax=viral metagenome TaxID=1070528 RepID=A0A6C0BZF6_9ZZZZ